MFSLGLIIGGGTAQIQKNIISERGPRPSPREPKPAQGLGDGSGEERMDFGLSEDQLLLEETMRGLPGRPRADHARARAARRGSDDCPNDPRDLEGLAELGVTGILVPEEHGGSALALLDAALVANPWDTR